MKRAYFCSSLRLLLRQAARKLPALLCMALAVLLLSAAAGLGAAGLLGSQRFSRFTIAVASEDQDPRLDPLMRIAGNMPEITSVADVVQADADTAAQMVGDGRAAAALILPAGFLDSAYSGQNLAPRLVVDSTRPVETALLEKMAQSTLQALTAAQRGVAYTLEIVDLAEPQSARRTALVEGINLRFIQWLLGNGEMYRHIVVNASGQLSVVQMYLLSAALFFLLLCTPMLYSLFSLYAERGWARRLRAAGCPLPLFAAAQLVAGTAALLAPFAVLLAGAGLVAGQGRPVLFTHLLAGVCLGALFLSCLGYLFCNAGGIMAAVGLNFPLALGALLLSGGLLPLAMLPSGIASLSALSPIAWMRDCLGALYGVAPQPLSYLLMAAACALLFCLCLLRSAHLERRHGT